MSNISFNLKIFPQDSFFLFITKSRRVLDQSLKFSKYSHNHIPLSL